jgi:predicted nucleic acid-binding protein
LIAMQHLLIADAGPLIALSRIQCLALLQPVFRPVTITTVVARELGCGVSLEVEGQALPAATAALIQALEDGWLTISAADGSAPYPPLNPGVDAAEASAIGLALQRQAAGDEVLLLIDGRCGRAEARHRRLAIIGTAAVLVLAKEQRLIEACAPLLSALREEGYYVLSDGLIQAVLSQVAEG